MRRSFIFDNYKRPKLPVIFSSEIIEKIDLIELANHDDKEMLSNFYDYIESVKNYISNPVIAWDYMNRYIHLKNGAVHIKELGYDVTFFLVADEFNYLYVFDLCLNPEGCEWVVPPHLEER